MFNIGHTPFAQTCFDVVKRWFRDAGFPLTACFLCFFSLTSSPSGSVTIVRRADVRSAPLSRRRRSVPVLMTRTSAARRKQHPYLPGRGKCENRGVKRMLTSLRAEALRTRMRHALWSVLALQSGCPTLTMDSFPFANGFSFVHQGWWRENKPNKEYGLIICARGSL